MSSFPPHIRACIFILIAILMATAYQYIFVRRQLFSIKWSALWASITGVTFISGNIWVLVFFLLLIFTYIVPKNGNQRVAYYFLLLPIIPPLKYVIPGVPGINYLFDLTYPRILVLLVLLPLFFRYLRQSKSPRNKLFAGPIDLLVIIYVVYLSILEFRGATFTSGIRSDFYLFIDIFVPYFVISRYVKTTEDIKQALTAILFSALMLSFIAILEAKYGWDFYNHLRSLLDFKPSRVATYLHSRGGYLRISATMSNIPFGYFLALSLGIFLYLKNQFKLAKVASIATLIVILIPLFNTGSRGAWLTAIIVSTVYMILRVRSTQKLFGIILLGMIVLSGLLLTDTAPVYEDKTGTFQYRKQLINVSLSVIKNNFFFGTRNPNENNALEVMRQGQGIIDIVNTYIHVALYYGVTGFVIFALIFIVTLMQLYKKYYFFRIQHKEEYSIGALLIAMVSGTIILISTVSSINFTPIYYWALIALSMAYIRVLPKSHDDGDS